MARVKGVRLVLEGTPCACCSKEMPRTKFPYNVVSPRCHECRLMCSVRNGIKHIGR